MYNLCTICCMICAFPLHLFGFCKGLHIYLLCYVSCFVFTATLIQNVLVFTVIASLNHKYTSESRAQKSSLRESVL